MLPLHYGRLLWFLKDLNPHHFIRSERCYPLHQRTIVTPDRFELPLNESKSFVLPLDDGVIKLERQDSNLRPSDHLRYLSMATNMTKNLVRKQKTRTFLGFGPLYSFLQVLHSNSQTRTTTLVPFYTNDIKHIVDEVMKQSFHVFIIIPQRYKKFLICQILFINDR